MSAHDREASYVALLRSGELEERAQAARARLESCDLCAHRCLTDRLAGAEGAFCRTGARARVASYGPHHGEEAPISGTRGSGTIFFAWCNLRCLYCQNAELSHMGEGREVDAQELATMMLELQERGCHNVNLVSPSHVVAPILEALVLAADAGLRVPIVYNTGGYDALETLRLLEDVVDVYMPDAKYADDAQAARHCGVSDYASVNRTALREMHRQVGDLVLNARGVATRGLLVRHLVLPAGLAGTDSVLRFIAEEISQDTFVNVMGQYRPCHEAHVVPTLSRRPTRDEMSRARELARSLGLARAGG